MKRLAFCCFFLLIGSTASAQIEALPQRSVTGAMVKSGVMRGAGQALAALADMRRMIADFNKDITEARAEWRRLYPDKPGFDEAAGKLAYLLQIKDANILNEKVGIHLTEQLTGTASNVHAAIALGGGGEKNYDGGIPWVARQAHENWTDTVMTGLDTSLDSLFSQKPFDMVQAYEQAMTEYELYVAVRDFAEFHRAGFASEFFPSDLSFVQFALQYDFEHAAWPYSREQMLEKYALLLDHYGEAEVKKAGHILRTSELSKGLQPRNWKELGIPNEMVYPRQALLWLLNRNASPKTFALATLATGFSKIGFEDGQVRYDAMVAAHGEAKVKRVAAQVQSMPVDEVNGWLASGDMAGLYRSQAMRHLLPLEEDPGMKRLLERRAKRKAEEERQRQEREARIHKIRTEKGRRMSEAQYDCFVQVLQMARELDEATKKPTDYAERIVRLAGYWNLFAKTDGAEYSGPLSRTAAKAFLVHLPSNQERERFLYLVNFTAFHFDFRTEYLIPMEQIQQERIDAGQLDPADAIDLSWTPRKWKLMSNLASTRSNFESLKTWARQSPTVARDPATKRRLEIFEKRIAREQRELDDYLAQGPPDSPDWTASTQADELGERQLSDILTARDLARAGDDYLLAGVNKTRRQAGLDPLNAQPNVELFIVAAAGLWNGYLLTGDEDYRSAARRAIQQAGNLDIDARGEYTSLFAFVNDPVPPAVVADPDDMDIAPVRPRPPSAVQLVQIREGALPPDRAINFDTTPQVLNLLLALQQARRKLSREVLGKSFGPGEEGKAKKREAMVPYMAEIERIEREIADYDQTNGHPSRLIPVSVGVAAADKPAAPSKDHPADNATPQDKPANQTPGARRPSDLAEADPPKPEPESRQSPEPAPTIDPGPREYDAFLRALALARESDAANLQKINEERAALGVEPIQHFTRCGDWVQMAAGFWDRYATSRDNDDAELAQRSLMRLSRIDRSASTAIQKALAFVMERPRGGEDAPDRSALSTVQSRRVVEGSLEADERLSLIASEQRFDLLQDVDRATDNLHRQELVVGKQKQRDLPERTLQRLAEQIESRRAKMAAAREALRAYDEQVTSGGAVSP